MSNVMKHTFDPSKHDIYVPRNPEKYIGKEYPIVRSSWERDYCRWCDSNPGIIAWGSEALEIPYFDPVKRKQRRYFPDFVMKTIGKDGRELTYIVEIKPYSETVAPVSTSGKSQKTKLYESMTFATNVSKWNAALEFCKRRGWIFKIITERELYKGKK
jgi:hypothetical protein